MVNWEATVLTVFLVMMTINVGLISVDTSGTVPESVLGDLNYTNLNFADINAQYTAFTERTQEGALECQPLDPLCSAIEAASVAFDSLTLGVSLMMSLFIFFTNNWYPLVFGYWLALNTIADKLEPSGVAIHTLFTTVSAAIFLISIFGLWEFIKSIARIARGAGG